MVDLTDKENPPGECSPADADSKVAVAESSPTLILLSGVGPPPSLDRLGTPNHRNVLRPKPNLSALIRFQAKVAATRQAAHNAARPPPPQPPRQSTATTTVKLAQPNLPQHPSTNKLSQLQSTRSPLTQPQPLTQASLNAVLALPPPGGQRPPAPPSPDGSNSSLTYADLPSDADNPLPSFAKLPPRISQVTAGLVSERPLGISSSSHPPFPAQPRPSQRTPPPFAKRSPRPSTSAAPGPAAIPFKRTTLRNTKPRAPVYTETPLSAPVLPDRLPTSAAGLVPSSPWTSATSRTPDPSRSHRSHKALAGQPPPPAEAPPEVELQIDPDAILAAFQRAHTSAPRKRRVDVDDGVEYVSGVEDEMEEEGGGADNKAGGSADRPGVDQFGEEGGRGSDETRSKPHSDSEDEHELGRDVLGELLGQAALRSSSATEGTTANQKKRPLRSKAAKASVTPTLNGSSEAVLSRGSASTTSSARKRKPRPPSPDSAPDSDEVPPHLAIANRTRQARPKKSKQSRKGLVVIKKNAPTSAEDMPLNSSAAVMAMLPPRRKYELDDGSDAGSVTVETDSGEKLFGRLA